MTASAALNRAMSEDELLAAVIEAARHYGWLVAHFRPALTGRGWKTPMQGDPGFPDLVLSRNGQTLFMELKREGKSLTLSQRRWQEAMGMHFLVIRPKDLNDALGMLAVIGRADPA